MGPSSSNRSIAWDQRRGLISSVVAMERVKSAAAATTAMAYPGLSRGCGCTALHGLHEVDCPVRAARGEVVVMAVSTSRTACLAVTCGLLLTACSSAVQAGGGTTSTASPAAGQAGIGTVGPEPFAESVDIGGRRVYLDCRGPETPRRPTILLVSGYHDSSDVWNSADVLSLLAPAVGPPVQEALADSHHVCSYDRPGTLRYIEGVPLTERSTPVSQPRTLADLVTELHELLHAASVPEPYVLVGHSLGGLLVQLYGQTHPDQVAGIVFVDAFSPTVPDLLGDRWPIYRDALSAPPAQVPSLSDPDAERVDLDASIAQVQMASPLPAEPLAVLTKTEPFAGLPDLPGLSAAEINEVYQRAEDHFVALAPTTPQIFATGSDHYIQFSQPDLLVRATELVLGRTSGS
jgi:pimeloyl-ACP methyl ester carboxylesterase